MLRVDKQETYLSCTDAYVHMCNHCVLFFVEHCTSLECCSLEEHHMSVVDFFSRMVLMTMLSAEI